MSCSRSDGVLHLSSPKEGGPCCFVGSSQPHVQSTGQGEPSSETASPLPPALPKALCIHTPAASGVEGGPGTFGAAVRLQPHQAEALGL